MKKLDVPQSGSQGQTTASRNRFGQYDRQRSMPTQPRTATQLAVRNQLSAASKAWSGLTDEQRASWENYSKQHPRTDSLGQSIVLTGHQTFVAVNVFNQQVGVAIQTDVPDGTVIPAPVLAVDNTEQGTFAVKAVTAIPVDTKVGIFVSPPMSPGRKFSGDQRLVKVVTGTNQANQNLFDYTDVAAKFGTVTVGQKYVIIAQATKGGNLSAMSTVSYVTAE
jgi:hypothetical protein